MKDSPVSLCAQKPRRITLSRTIMLVGLLAAWSQGARGQPIVVGLGPDSASVLRSLAPLALPVRVTMAPVLASVPPHLLAAFQGTLVWDVTLLRLDSLRTAPGSPLMLTANLASAATGRIPFNAFGAVGMSASAAVAVAFFTPQRAGDVTLTVEVEVAGDEQGRSIRSQVRGRPIVVCLGEARRAQPCAVSERQDVARGHQPMASGPRLASGMIPELLR